MLILLFLGGSLQALAQDSASIYQRTISQFDMAYKNQQPDSIYKLFAPSLQAKLLPSLWSGSFVQLLRTAGSLGKFQEAPSKNADKQFVATTDNPGLDLNMDLDSAGYIEGLRVIQKKQPKKSSSHSNFIFPATGGSLYGTMTLPADTVKVPVVLIIAGSGPTDRDGNNPLGVSSDTYKMLAEALKDSGVASLRYDKRLIGESSQFSGSTDSIKFDDMVADATALADSLKKDPRFSSVTIFGHSEGSLIGMIAAGRSGADQFISAAGIGFGADTVLLKQIAEGGLSADIPVATQLFDSLKRGYRVSAVPADLQSVFSPSIQGYVQSWLAYHPREEIAKLHIPVLIIQGNHDIQVSADNADTLKSANPAAQLLFIHTMNHILKDAPADRAQNLESYKNVYLPLNRQFVRSVVRFVKTSKL